MKTDNIAKGLPELCGGYTLEDFRPLAYYHKHLDCIRVQIKDCSFREVRMNNIFTIWYANHGNQEPMGFTIKGIKYLFRKLGLPESDSILLASIIDKIVQEYPEDTINTAVNIIKGTNLRNSLDLEIDLKAA